MHVDSRKQLSAHVHPSDFVAATAASFAIMLGAASDSIDGGILVASHADKAQFLVGRRMRRGIYGRLTSSSFCEACPPL